MKNEPKEGQKRTIKSGQKKDRVPSLAPEGDALKNTAGIKFESRTFVRLSVVTMIKRLHQGAQKGRATNLGRCPSRTASKTSMPTLNGQRNFQLHINHRKLRRTPREKGSNYFNYFAPRPATPPTPSLLYTHNRLVTSWHRADRRRF